jgi:hypothetical protein
MSTDGDILRRSLVCNIGSGLMQLCHPNSPSLLVMCKGSASDTLSSVLLLGLGSSFEEKEGEEGREEVGVVGVVGVVEGEEVVVVVAEWKDMFIKVMMLDRRVKRIWPFWDKGVLYLVYI